MRCAYPPYRVSSVLLTADRVVGWVKRSGPINAPSVMGPLRLTHPTSLTDVGRRHGPKRNPPNGCVSVFDSVGWISTAHPPFVAVMVDALRLSTLPGFIGTVDR